MIDDENNQIVYRDYVDISVAVATPKVGDFYPVCPHDFVVIYVFFITSQVYRYYNFKLAPANTPILLL